MGDHCTTLSRFPIFESFPNKIFRKRKKLHVLQLSSMTHCTPGPSQIVTKNLHISEFQREPDWSAERSLSINTFSEFILTKEE